MTQSTRDIRKSIVERKLVRYDNTATDIRDSLSAAFGYMVGLAAPVVAFHLADLYYDARWLHENATGTTFTFLWSFDDTGTAIGTSTDALDRAHGYRITLTLDEQHHTWLTLEHAARATYTSTDADPEVPAPTTATVSGILLDTTTANSTTRHAQSAA
jgi:hypothetical protein